MQWPFKTTVRYVQEHKTVRIQYAVCADNVAGARSELMRRFTEESSAGRAKTRAAFGPKRFPSPRLGLPNPLPAAPPLPSLSLSISSSIWSISQIHARYQEAIFC